MNQSAPTRIVIAMPSLNRGLLAKKQTDRMMEYLDKYENVSLHVWVNGEWDEDYRSIDERVVLHHGKPDGFFGAFVRVLRECDADVVVLTSDEDIIPEKAVKVFSTMNWDGTALARGSGVLDDGVKVGNHFKIEGNKKLKKGTEALTYYAFFNNYLPGTAYNLNLMRPMIDILESPEGEKHKWYPHLFFELLACITGDIALMSIPTVIEGEGVRGSVNPYTSQYSFGSRLDQHLVMKDGLMLAISLMGWDFELYKNLYYQLCDRTMYKIREVNGSQYKAIGLDIDDLEKSATEFFQACVRGDRCDATSSGVDRPK